MKDDQSGIFSRLAVWCGDAFGSPANFIMWLVLITIWLITGPMFHYSNTWQLLINTPTTIIELFAAILIQYVGNRIERRQEEHESKMLKILEHLEQLNETRTSEISTNNLAPGTVIAPTIGFEQKSGSEASSVPETADLTA